MPVRFHLNVPTIGDTTVIAASARQALELCVDHYAHILTNQDTITLTDHGRNIARTVGEIKHDRITMNHQYQFNAYMEEGAK